VVDAFRTALKLDGEPAGWNYRMSIASPFFALIDYGRRSGAADNLSAAFVRDPALHRIPEEEANEGEIGKAIPEPVIRQLDAHLPLLGQGRARGQRTLGPADLQLMYRTLYILLRDTGRRPLEVLSLPRDCLETRKDHISLVWNNHKARRHRRRLPITTPTIQAIRTWQERRERLQNRLPPTGADYLFPALMHLATRPYLHTSWLPSSGRRPPRPPRPSHPPRLASDAAGPSPAIPASATTTLHPRTAATAPTAAATSPTNHQACSKLSSADPSAPDRPARLALQEYHRREQKTTMALPGEAVITGTRWEKPLVQAGLAQSLCRKGPRRCSGQDIGEAYSQRTTDLARNPATPDRRRAQWRRAG
jgi:hypothetical protein